MVAKSGLMNMSPDDLHDYLDTDVAWNTGQFRPGETESIGHQRLPFALPFSLFAPLKLFITSGRQILDILRNAGGQYTQEDIQMMRRTISFIKRHLAQRHNIDPAKMVDGKWRGPSSPSSFCCNTTSKTPV